MSIGILYICTGRYQQFWDEFYRSAERYFLPSLQKTYFVFSDAEPHRFSGDSPTSRSTFRFGGSPVSGRGVTVIPTPAEPWPLHAFKRYRYFNAQKDLYRDCSHLIFFNANYVFVEKVTESEFLPQAPDRLVAALHPGHFDMEEARYPYCRDPRSAAHIAPFEGRVYVCGGINGGECNEFLAATAQLDAQIETDLARGIQAPWNDESHWNKFINGRRDVRLLSPRFVVPEEALEFPFKPKLLLRDKLRPEWGGHEFMRGATDHPVLPADRRPSHFERIREESRLLARCRRLVRGRAKKSIKVVDFFGGLGEQLFQFAFLLSLRERFPRSRVVANLVRDQNYVPPSRFELTDVFPNLELEFLQEEESVAEMRLKPVELKANYFAPHIYEATGDIRYIGRWCSYRYFPSDIDSLRRALQLPDKSYDGDAAFRGQESVALHVERAVDGTFPDSTDDHVRRFNCYFAACADLKRLVANPQFFVFSDDPEWAREHFSGREFTIFSDLDPLDPHREFHLMRRCKHQIISGSTLCWWAAWLNPHPHKVILAPDAWPVSRPPQSDSDDLLHPAWLQTSNARNRF